MLPFIIIILFCCCCCCDYSFCDVPSLTTIFFEQRFLDPSTMYKQFVLIFSSFCVYVCYDRSFSSYSFFFVCVCVRRRNSLIRQRWSNGGDSLERQRHTKRIERKKEWQKAYAHSLKHSNIWTNLTATLKYQKRKTTPRNILIQFIHNFEIWI